MALSPLSAPPACRDEAADAVAAAAAATAAEAIGFVRIFMGSAARRRAPDATIAGAAGCSLGGTVAPPLLEPGAADAISPPAGSVGSTNSGRGRLSPRTSACAGFGGNSGLVTIALKLPTAALRRRAAPANARHSASNAISSNAPTAAPAMSATLAAAAVGGGTLISTAGGPSRSALPLPSGGQMSTREEPGPDTFSASASMAPSTDPPRLTAKPYTVKPDAPALPSICAPLGGRGVDAAAVGSHALALAAAALPSNVARTAM